MSQRKPFLLTADEIQEMPEIEVHHPLTPASELQIRSLSREVGLERLGLHLVRIPPGKEGCEYHAHHYEEEFFYILSGRGTALIDGVEFQVGPGDFMGFPAPSVAHGLKNPFESDLVYIVGGERKEFEIGEFPRHNKLLIRNRAHAHIVSCDALEAMSIGESESEAT